MLGSSTGSLTRLHDRCQMHAIQNSPLGAFFLLGLLSVTEMSLNEIAVPSAVFHGLSASRDIGIGPAGSYLALVEVVAGKLHGKLWF